MRLLQATALTVLSTSFFSTTTVMLLTLSASSPTIVSAQQKTQVNISAACFNETNAILKAGKVDIEYDKYTGSGGCDSNKTYEVCDMDYIDSNTSDYEKACNQSRGTYYTYDYTLVCPANDEENLTAYRRDVWYEPDCLGPSCTMEEAELIFELQHPGCSVNTSFIETWEFGRPLETASAAIATMTITPAGVAMVGLFLAMLSSVLV
jgi:hypothetical protein